MLSLTASLVAVNTFHALVDVADPGFLGADPPATPRDAGLAAGPHQHYVGMTTVLSSVHSSIE